MAAGDTIAGQVRFLREDTEGNRRVVFGALKASSLDGKNGTLSPEEKVYVNTMYPNGVEAPLQAKEYDMGPVTFFPGEKIVVQHLSSNLEEAADFDVADGVAIDIIKKDRNTGNKYTATLTEADTELSANPTTSTSEWTDIFEETVPDRQEWRIAGSIEAGAYEAA